MPAKMPKLFFLSQLTNELRGQELYHNFENFVPCGGTESAAGAPCVRKPNGDASLSVCRTFTPCLTTNHISRNPGEYAGIVHDECE